ncbi:MAG: chemotaxis protein CheV [Geobacteraceae bacterium]|nr:chemotaxis protein CheV [Geobacteraceae bacterium]
MAGNTNILLESGTNELEIVEFCVNDGDRNCYYGVNVAKVREIIRTPKLTPVLSAPEMVAGMMSLRDRIIPVIDLARVLGWQPSAVPDKILVLEFNRVTVGILVNGVSRIFRLSWEQVVAPSKLSEGAYVTGMVKMEGRIVLILDFERILAELCQNTALTPVEETWRPEPGASTRTVLVVDDSAFIRNAIASNLRAAGYRAEEAINGEEAWNLISERLAADTFTFDAIITDIEMPRMDGLHLTSLVRADALLREIPLFIFSSLASEDNIRKWKSLGADGILTKPDMPNLVAIISGVFEGREEARQ